MAAQVGEDMTDIENREKKHSCFTQYIQFLLIPRAGIILPALYLVIIFLFQVLKTAMTFLTAGIWQLSGYYLSGLENGLLLFLTASWLISIVMLFLNRQHGRGIRRTLAIPLVFFVGGIAAVILNLMLPSRICGWPIDTIYSEDNEKHFIISRGPLPIDIYYHIYSTKQTLLDPKWIFEFPTGSLGFSRNGSITEDPHLILSEDEKLLVMGRGDRLTDAILIDSKVSLVNNIRESQIREKQIKSLLKKHSTKSESEDIQNPLTYPQIRTILKEYYQKMGKELTERFKNDGWIVSCELSTVDQDGVKIQTDYTVKCSKENKRSSFSRDMRLVDDYGRLIIVEQDNGLTWSDDEEKALCENIRDAITEIAGAGTYIN